MKNNAGIVLVGDELLSGKIADSNGIFLIRELRKLGIPTTEMHMVGDDPGEIREQLRLTHQRCQHVFTCGGVGPTHDDRTLPAIAEMLGVQMVRSEELVRMVQENFEGHDAKIWEKVAWIPEGCRLMYAEGNPWPAYWTDRIWALPGSPRYVREKFTIIRKSLKAGQSFETLTLYFSIGEGMLAEPLRALAGAFPDVTVGSYPATEDDQGFLVRVALESLNLKNVEKARDMLLGLVGDTALIRIERGAWDHS